MRKQFLLACLALFTGQAFAYTAYVLDNGNRIVYVIDTTTNAVTAVIPTSLTPFSSQLFNIAVNPTQSQAYVTDYGMQDVFVIDTMNNTIEGTVSGAIPAFATVHGIAYTTDGTLAYVANYNSGANIYVIDAGTNEFNALVTNSSPAAFIQPTNIAINGAIAYATDQGSSSIYVIDTTTSPPITMQTVTGATFSDPFAVAYNGSFAYATDLSGSAVYKINGTVAAQTTNSFTPFISPHGVAITPNGTFAYIADEGVNPTTSGNVYVINTGTNEVLGTVSTTGFPPFQFPGAVAITPDGAFAYVTDLGASAVFVIDTTQNKVVATVSTTGFTAFASPLSIAIASAPTPPTNFTGRLSKDNFLSQSDLIDFLMWDPSIDSTVVEYQVSEDGIVIGTVSANGPFTFAVHNRKKSSVYTYSLVALNGAGIPSNPLLVTVP